VAKVKDKSKFEWEDTGDLKIRYDGERSASLRFFPSDKVIAENLAKFAHKTAIQPKRKMNINSHINQKKPNKGE
jgi:hypothetical protein